MYVVPNSYYSRLGQVESGNNPMASAGTSSASGLYQFTRGTWEGLGYDWSNRFDTGLQNEAVRTLTQQNAMALGSKGVLVDEGSLYGAHFLGASTAAKVYNASPGTAITDLVSSKVLDANKAVFKSIATAGDFVDWAAGKMKISGNDIENGVKAGVQALTGDFLGAGSTILGGGGGDNIFEKFLKWLKELFSANTFARLAFVVVGFILVLGAAWALLNNTDKIIETVKGKI